MTGKQRGQVTEGSWASSGGGRLRLRLSAGIMLVWRMHATFAVGGRTTASWYACVYKRGVVSFVFVGRVLCSSKRWRRAARFTGDIIISGGLVLLIIPHGQGITRVALMRNQGPRATSCARFPFVRRSSKYLPSLSFHRGGKKFFKTRFFFFKSVKIIYMLRCCYMCRNTEGWEGIGNEIRI